MRLFSFAESEKDNTNSVEITEYRKNMEYLQNRLIKVRNLFDCETDPQIIESLIFEETALIIRIDNLIKSAKQNKLSLFSVSDSENQTTPLICKPFK